MNKFSKDGVMLKKQTSESLFCLFMQQSIHESSFNSLNMKSKSSNITPLVHNHFLSNQKTK